MMLPLRFFAFFVVAVFKVSEQSGADTKTDAAPADSPPPPFTGSAPPKKVACDTSGANFPVSHIDKTTDTKWAHNFMYPFKVCATSKGLDNVEVKCDHDRKAHITLEILPPGAKEHVQNNFEYPVASITPSGTVCHIYKVSEIVTNMAGKAVAGTKWGAHSIIFGTLKDATKESTSQVSVSVAPYRFDKPGKLPAHKGDYKEHGVVCTFKGCKIEVTGSFDTVSVERFKAAAGKTPTLEKGEGPLAADMFSVSLYECKDKCPTGFEAKSSKAGPIAAAYYLSIGTVLAVALFVSEA